MNAVASLAPDRRAELFEDTVEVHDDVTLGSLVEKDFWVCWTLYRLFGLNDQIPLIFKGGTSLSKAYGVIRRFSEDIDLSLNREALGFVGESDPARAPSRKKAARLIEELDTSVSDHLKTRLIPELREDFRGVIGPEDGPSPWAMEQTDEVGHTWSFSYPMSSITVSEDSYVRPQVLLEFGARSEHEPRETRRVQPYAAESFPNEFVVPVCTVDTLLIDRTFWEKITLLHMIANGGVDRLKGRMARHYYDVYMLSQTEYGERAMGRLDLLEEVAKHKQVFYRCAWAHYEEARPGNLRLVPDGDVVRRLESDYHAMGQLFFDEPPEFADILGVVRGIEQRINKTP